MIAALSSHLWQSTLFALAAGLFTLAFRNNRASVRYWLWFSASLKFCIPFSLLIALGSQLGWMPAAQKIAAPEISFVMERITQPLLEPLASLAPVPRTGKWIPIAILGVWLCGFAAIVWIRLRAWLGIRAALRAGTTLEVRASVEIRSSPGLLEPGVAGLVRPVLLLPAGIIERLPAPQLEAVLAHELCHVRRRDNLFAAVHMAVEAVFWFHPLVWWIGARLIEERERACDEGVLRLGSEPRIYADAILNVCKLYVESPLRCVSGVTGANLKRRIEAIMISRTGQALNGAKKILLAGAGAAAVAVPVAVGIVIGAGHVPAIFAQPLPLPQATQAAQPPAPVNAVAQAVRVPATPDRPQDHQLVAMLFDFDTMTADEQSRVRKSAVDYVHTRIAPADMVAVMAVENGRVMVVHDFTNDQSILQAAILRLSAGNASSVAGASPRLWTLESATTMLAAIPQKKMLIYFASGVARPRVEDQAELQNAIEMAQKANVAIFPIDARTADSSYAAAPPVAIYEGVPDTAPAVTVKGLPGRHATMQVSAVSESQKLIIPLDALSGRVDVYSEISAVDAVTARHVAALQDAVESSLGMYEAKFILKPGTYVCRLVVKERSSGQVYGEAIHFEIK
jgi:beta-lactamase regulating signal transducer with metallopeptidase domain